MKSKPTLQESKPVFFLFLFLSTNNECLMFSNDLYKINQIEHITKKRKKKLNLRKVLLGRPHLHSRGPKFFSRATFYTK